mgnify:CR=1 FL=1
MTEINQIERAKLAYKHKLDVQFQYDDGIWDLARLPAWSPYTCYRVHPDDEEKLEAIVWEGADSEDYIRAYAVGVGGFIQYLPDNSEAPEHWKLIATRELPAEKESTRDEVAEKHGLRIYADNEYSIVRKGDELLMRQYVGADNQIGDLSMLVYMEELDRLMGDELPAEEPDLSAMAIPVKLRAEESAKNAQLVADLKEFVTDYAKGSKGKSEADVMDSAKALLERINPKLVRNSTDLPADTLCQVYADGGWYNLYNSDVENQFLPFGVTSGTYDNHSDLVVSDNFKVLEQPKPTFWQGGECPIPCDWVEFEVHLRNGRIIEGYKGMNWQHGNPVTEHTDIIAYRILGEKND